MKKRVSGCDLGLNGKAFAARIGDKEILFSYGTPVAIKDFKTGEVQRTWDGRSATTSKHINAWGRIDAKDWAKLPVVEAAI